MSELVLREDSKQLYAVAESGVRVFTLDRETGQVQDGVHAKDGKPLTFYPLEIEHIDVAGNQLVLRLWTGCTTVMGKIYRDESPSAISPNKWKDEANHIVKGHREDMRKGKGIDKSKILPNHRFVLTDAYGARKVFKFNKDGEVEVAAQIDWDEIDALLSSGTSAKVHIYVRVMSPAYTGETEFNGRITPEKHGELIKILPSFLHEEKTND